MRSLTDGRLYTIAHQLRYNAFGTAALTRAASHFSRYSTPRHQAGCHAGASALTLLMHGFEHRYITKLVACDTTTSSNLAADFWSIATASHRLAWRPSFELMKPMNAIELNLFDIPQLKMGP